MGGRIKELIYFILVWGIASLVWKTKMPVPYWLAALKMFPYFMVGHYFAQYRLLSNGCLKKQWVQTAAILLYIMTMAVSIKTNFHFVNLTGIFAINENLILAAMVCSIVSVFIIAFCMIVAKIVKQSLILDYLRFGVKKKNN